VTSYETSRPGRRPGLQSGQFHDGGAGKATPDGAGSAGVRTHRNAAIGGAGEAFLNAE